MRGRRLLFLIAAVLGLVSGAFSAWLCHPLTRAGLLSQGLWRAELISYDYRLSHSLATERSPNVVLVTIDDESLSQEALQVWPWPRSFHAKVLQELRRARPRLIGYDVIFAGVSGQSRKGNDLDGPLTLPEASPEDRQLTSAIKQAGNVILAMEVARSAVAGKEGAAELEVGNFPFEDFEDAACGLASVNLPRDLDGVIRRIGVSVTFQDERFLSLPIALAARYLGTAPGPLGARVLREGYATHPALGGNSVLLPYRAPVGAGFIRIPIHRVLSGDYDRSQVRGKIVLIGSTASSLQDLHATPMALRGEGGAGGKAALMPGVEVLANATDAFLERRYVLPLRPIWSALLTVLVSLLMSLLLVHLHPAKALLLGWIPLLILSLVFTFELFWTRHLWVPLVPLLMGITLSYGAGTVYLELTAERAQRRLRQAWARRVSPEVLSVILNNPGLTRVKGRRLVGTVVFTDLQGFTTFCQSHPPELVVDRVNEYFSVAAEVTRKYGGTILKFIGDGVMTVFGDPVEQPDHAERAVRASIEFVERMRDLNRSAGPDDWVMHVRIGIHTGELVAGDVGPEHLLEYTVMGDTVSTASRLEGINKDFGTQILLSAETARQLGDALPLLALGEVEVRGRSGPMQVYTVKEGTGREAQT